MKCFKSNEDNKNKDNMTIKYESKISKKGTKEIIEKKY